MFSDALVSGKPREYFLFQDDCQDARRGLVKTALYFDPLPASASAAGSPCRKGEDLLSHDCQSGAVLRRLTRDRDHELIAFSSLQAAGIRVEPKVLDLASTAFESGARSTRRGLWCLSLGDVRGTRRLGCSGSPG